MKKLVSLLLAVVLCLTFAACANQGGTEQSAPETTAAVPKEPVDLTGKTIIWNGDSICAGRLGTSNWADRIAENNNMTYKNFAVSGGTVADGLPPTSGGNIRHSVVATLEQMYKEYPDADFIVFEGGTNDADLLGHAVGGASDTKLGTVDPENFSGSYRVNTFCGALEYVFYRAKQLWPDKKIVYIVAPKMGNKSNPTYENRRYYFDKAVEICKKWDIPYIDLWNDSELDPNLPEMYDSTKTPEQNMEENTGYYIDGQHLTARGYDVTAEMIEAWLKTA